MTPVLAEHDEGVLVLTLNRPDRLNAWTNEMTTVYFDHLTAAESDPSVRVIVLTGAGRGFCAGADFQVLQAIQEGSARGVGPSERGAGQAQKPDERPYTLPATIRKPIIAAVNGACAGLGMVHALMCDLVFTASSAKWTTAFARRGLIAEYGMSWVLPRLIGQARAMDVLLSGRTFGGDEAFALGLAARSCPDGSVLPETLAYARDLAVNCSPASMARIKQQVWGDWTTDLDASHERAVRHMIESFGRPDFKEGVASFVERREPRFPPLSHDP